MSQSTFNGIAAGIRLHVGRLNMRECWRCYSKCNVIVSIWSALLRANLKATSLIYTPLTASSLIRRLLAHSHELTVKSRLERLAIRFRHRTHHDSNLISESKFKHFLLLAPRFNYVAGLIDRLKRNIIR